MLRFSNGLFRSRELMRAKKPNPRLIDGQEDDTDYLKRPEKCFNPGVMLSAVTGHSSSAGILVEKDNQQRLTVAIHKFQYELDKFPTKLGDTDHFIVKQGDWDTGTVVGNVTERMGQSEIGLATLTKPLNNSFLDLAGSATALIHLVS